MTRESKIPLGSALHWSQLTAQNTFLKSKPKAFFLTNRTSLRKNVYKCSEFAVVNLNHYDHL